MAELTNFHGFTASHEKAMGLQEGAGDDLDPNFGLGFKVLAFIYLEVDRVPERELVVPVVLFRCNVTSKTFSLQEVVAHHNSPAEDHQVHPDPSCHYSFLEACEACFRSTLCSEQARRAHRQDHPE